MKATYNWLTENYKKYNELIFNNELPNGIDYPRQIRLQLKVKPTKSFFGVFKIRKGLFKDYILQISNFYDVDENVLIDTLVHEMIHEYICFKKIRDTSSHGREFKRIMNKINREYNLNMTVSADLDSLGIKQPINKRKINDDYYVFTLKLTNGQYYVSSIAPSCVKTIDREIKHLPITEEYMLYHTHNPMFRKYPRCRTVRGRLVTKSEYNKINLELFEEARKRA